MSAPTPDPRRPGEARPPRAPDSTPESTPFAAERLTAIAHELNNLVDGSRRCLLLAMRAIDEAEDAAPLDRARERIETASSALERICDIVHNAMTNSRGTLASLAANRATFVSLEDAARHAVQVVQPIADEAGVTIRSNVDPIASELPVGPLYTVMLNALRNAVEAVVWARRPGTVALTLALESERDSAVTVRITVIDDGLGLPKGLPIDQLFRYGVSTKMRGGGMGLAMSRDIVHELGGQIELRERTDGASGAQLTVRYPHKRQNLPEVG